MPGIQQSKRDRYTAVDLFCGAGGLSLGAARAGLRVAASIDSDKRAISVHAKNFPESIHIEADITTFHSWQLFALTGLKKNEIEAVVGGAPCQGFSRIGQRNPGDPRNSLLLHFFRIVSEIRPHFFLFENVPGILDNCFDELRCHALGQVKGYRILGPLVLKASDFGAATSRKRVFFIGYHPGFYHDISKVDFTSHNSRPPIDVQSALKGLRKAINPLWQHEIHAWRPLTCKPRGWFWRKIFDDIPPGVGNRQAMEMLKKQKLVSGCLGTNHTPEVLKRFKSLREGAVDGPSRAIRLERNGLCPTLRSGTGPDRGSFQALRPIHPTEHRVITPREAARLQGFPDWFQFDKTKWHSFRQIGNSVSPILAEVLFRTILSKRK